MYVTELTLNNSGVFTIPQTNETNLKHAFQNIKYGEKYRFSISTDVDGAILAPAVLYYAPPIPPPHQVTAFYEKGTFTIHWQERGLPESILKDLKYHYEILVNEGERHINESTAEIIPVKQPSFIYPKVKENKMYAFAVRVVTDEGYKSVLSEVLSTRPPRMSILIFLIKCNVYNLNKEFFKTL